MDSVKQFQNMLVAEECLYVKRTWFPPAGKVRWPPPLAPNRNPLQNGHVPFPISRWAGRRRSSTMHFVSGSEIRRSQPFWLTQPAGARKFIEHAQFCHVGVLSLPHPWSAGGFHSPKARKQLSPSMHDPPQTSVPVSCSHPYRHSATNLVAETHARSCEPGSRLGAEPGRTSRLRHRECPSRCKQRIQVHQCVCACVYVCVSRLHADCCGVEKKSRV